MKNSIMYSSFNMNTTYDYKNLIKLQASQCTERIVPTKVKVKIKEKNIKLRNR